MIGNFIFFLNVLVTALFLTVSGHAYATASYPEAIQILEQEALSYHSDVVLIKKGDDILYKLETYDEPTPIAAWSITKSFISLGIGFLYDEGKINIDQPVSDFFPEWKEGRKKHITVRHLLTHTSGIDPSLDLSSYIDIISGNTLQVALSKEVVHEPGTVFAYNNPAVNILAGIIEKVSGMRTDLFIKERLLDPLDIVDYYWDIDEAGHALGMCGLHIHADDLLKVAELMLNKGVHNGKRLVSEEWIDQALTPTGFFDKQRFPGFFGCGYLFWLNDEEPRFYTMTGFLGQYCAIFPKERVIAIRQHDFRKSLPEEIGINERSFRTFFKEVRNVIDALNSYEKTSENKIKKCFNND